MQIVYLFALLVFCHFVFDYPLQGDFLARAKNRFEPVPHVPWYHPMAAHTFMHGAAVYVILGVWWLGVLEMISHFIIDDRKCAGELTYSQDQIWHISLKALWIVLALVIA